MTAEKFEEILDSIDGSAKTIMYVYSDAFTTCDCGKDLMLTQRVYGDAAYKGICSCGKSWALSNGKIQCWQIPQ